MTSRLVFFVAAAATIMPVAASAQTVDQLLADHAQLRSELDRCKQLGMASNDDPRCRTARTAEQRRFFGSAPTYTDRPVRVYPDAPVPDLRPPKTNAGPPHG